MGEREDVEAGEQDALGGIDHDLVITGLPGLPAPDPTLSIPGYSEYEIDFEQVLRSDLPQQFAMLVPAALTRENVSLLPQRARGAYILFLDEQPVYAGKTDHIHGFRNRLGRHVFTLKSRRNLDTNRMFFKAVRIAVFSILDVESILIKAMKEQMKGSLPWNGWGLGSNDPGRNREAQEPGPFDLKYPINIDIALDPFPVNDGPSNLLSALVALKDGLPYLFRYETDLMPNGKPAHPSRGHEDQRAASIVIPSGPKSMRDFLHIALEALPRGWVATVFPGRVILYREPDMTWKFALERIVPTES